MRTLVIQSFRTETVPPPIERCMASVRDWAKLNGYDYEFRGDELFEVCGADYLACAGDNKRTITNLARLEWIRSSLADGYDRAIWLDADIFIFDQARFSLDIQEDYAFSKETIVWWAGGPMVSHATHNAALVFAGHHPDLDVIIKLIRHIAATRPLKDNFQVGVKLLTGLHAGLSFPLLTNVGMFSPDTIHSIARQRPTLSRILAKEHGFPIYAANIAMTNYDQAEHRDLGRAMDILEATGGRVINRYLGADPPAPLLVDEYGSTFRPILRPSLPRRVANGLLPTNFKQRIAPLFRAFR